MTSALISCLLDLDFCNLHLFFCEEKKRVEGKKSVDVSDGRLAGVLSRVFASPKLNICFLNVSSLSFDRQRTQ